MNTITVRFLRAALVASAETSVHEANRQDYPYSNGINVEDMAGRFKILATSLVSIIFDDVNSIQDASDEAMMEANFLLYKFISEDIMSDEMINGNLYKSYFLKNPSSPIRKQKFMLHDHPW